MSTQLDVTSALVSPLTGRVKWFNNKAGYGFITVTDGERSGTDIFVHHSSIGVSSQQYKYLVQGEYVNFGLITSQGGIHEFQASSVCGIKNGKLMCETRREFKMARTTYKTSDVQDETQDKPQDRPQKSQHTTPKVRGEGPRDSAQKEWSNVTNPKTKSVKPRSSPHSTEL